MAALRSTPESCHPALVDGWFEPAMKLCITSLGPGDYVRPSTAESAAPDLPSASSAQPSEHAHASSPTTPRRRWFKRTKPTARERLRAALGSVLEA
jgi:hypothetical protein